MGRMYEVGLGRGEREEEEGVGKIKEKSYQNSRTIKKNR